MMTEEEVRVRKEAVVTKSRYCKRLHLERLKKTTEELRIVRVPEEIRTKYCLNTNLQRDGYARCSVIVL
jgi:hypothetical protein